MKIFIDIGHPAHVHYFKHFIRQMKANKHEVIITARDKEIALQLLDFYQIDYYNRGKGKTGIVGKMFNIIKVDLFLLSKAIKHKPDLFFSFGSPYAAHVSWLMRKPHIAFDDTDNNPFEQLMYVPFTKHILTPTVYKKDYGQKHIRFDGFMELGSLHPNRFVPSDETIQINDFFIANQRYVVFRFVAWQASHDIGLKGLTLTDKIQLVTEMAKFAKVIISSESPLPDELKPYSYSVHPAKMHDVLYHASLLVTESLTMAAEASFLGTPTICISTAEAGTLDEEVRLGLIELYRTKEGLAERAIKIIKDDQFKNSFKLKALNTVRKLVDLTALMVWLVSNYPNSIKQAKSTKNYQDQFKQ